ncbi:MAG: glycerophosphodiester phosphodiesterase [Actinobacteria bacterium]|nr:MAG: glycerophosphodiester phosphodiesterase [Actinomycetota bacterium]
MIPVVAGGCPIIFAHRGGAEEAAENSMAAFDRMRQLGIRHIETDAHVTADGHVVLHHDETVDRTYDGEGKVSELNWRDLMHMRNSAGERMPLLEEVLEAHPDLWFNIDAKSDAVVEPLLKVLHRNQALGRVMLASFSESRLRKIRALEHGKVSTSLGTSAVARLVAAVHTGSNPATWHVPGPRQGVRAVQVPHFSGPLAIVNRRFVAAAHALGLAVHVWTVNDAAEMQELIDLRVDGLVTDRPTLARGLLLARGVWREAAAPTH